MSTRDPAVADLFYPAQAKRLAADVETYLSDAEPSQPTTPKAIIAPHAGYRYSGPIAGSVYALLAPVRETIKRVVLAGPSHFFAFRGVAASGADAFRSPLGEVPVDQETIGRLAETGQVQILDEAHRREHSLEVHLPFLQICLSDFSIVPLVIGQASSRDVADVFSATWGGPETLFVISSDLSHYHDYLTAQRLDRHTAKAIEALQPEAIEPDLACGCLAIQGLLHVAIEKGLHARTIDLRNSGDTAGSRNEVVGYGAFVVG